MALAAALLSGFNLLRISRHEDRSGRLVMLRDTSLETAAAGRARGSRWYDRLGSLVAASPIVGIPEQQRLLGALAAAGIKGHGNLATFIASKVCGAAVFSALLWFFLEWEQLFANLAIIRFALLLGGLMLGWRLPDIILSRLAARRRRRIEQGLPDALDLLVVCAEAGLSLDQAIEQVGMDLHTSNPDRRGVRHNSSRNAGLVGSRRGARKPGQRTGLLSLRSITATLSQSLRFGTPLAESMRILAAEMRNDRMARIEERAARLPVLFAIPLMLFILPSLMMVIGTPVGLHVIDALGRRSRRGSRDHPARCRQHPHPPRCARHPLPHCGRRMGPTRGLG